MPRHFYITLARQSAGCGMIKPLMEVIAAAQYLLMMFHGELLKSGAKINHIRLNLGRIFILGLEFIVASDLIGTTTTPDYYALGLAAIIVLIRTLPSFSLNRELMSLSKH